MLAKVKKTGQIVDVYPVEDINGYIRSNCKYAEYGTNRRFNHDSIVLEGNLELNLYYEKMVEAYDRVCIMNTRATLLAGLLQRKGEISAEDIDYVVELAKDINKIDK